MVKKIAWIIAGAISGGLILWGVVAILLASTPSGGLEGGPGVGIVMGAMLLTIPSMLIGASLGALFAAKRYGGLGSELKWWQVVGLAFAGLIALPIITRSVLTVVKLIVGMFD